MTDIPLIQPADMTKPYPPESGDFPASDHGSHGIREDDFIAMMEILGTLHKEGKTVLCVTCHPGIAEYAHRSIRPDDGRIAEES